MRATSTDVLNVVTSGAIAPEDITYARHRITHVVDRIDEPVLFCRLKLTLSPDPARARPGIAEVTVEVNGDLIRAHVAAPTIQVAADLLKDRLASQLRERAKRFESRRRLRPLTKMGEWRHGGTPTQRPEYYDRPKGERELMGRKTYSPRELTPEEAIFEMEMLDFDFHLFRDSVSGREAVVERVDGDGYSLSRLEPCNWDPPDGIALSDAPVPTLPIDDAISLFDMLERRFLFFVDVSGHGSVLYRRYDGHYGLIVPA